LDESATKKFACDQMTAELLNNTHNGCCEQKPF